MKAITTFYLTLFSGFITPAAFSGPISGPGVAGRGRRPFAGPGSTRQEAGSVKKLKDHLLPYPATALTNPHISFNLF